MRHGFTNQKCPRCGGNLYFDVDYLIEGRLISWFEQESCLQCGYISYETNSPLTALTSNDIALQKEPLLV